MNDLPTGTYATAIDLSPLEVGQEVLNYQFSGRVDTIERGPTIWQANITLVTEQGFERFYLAWAQSLRGATGTFRIPLQPSARFAPQNHTGAVKRQVVEVVSAATGNFSLMADPTDTSSADDTYAPALHDLVNVGDRLVRVSYVSGGLMNVSPGLSVKVGDNVSVSQPYLKCRLRSGTAPVLSMTRATNNVQTISVIEAI